MQSNSDALDTMSADYTSLFANATPVRGKYYEHAMREKGFVKLEPDRKSALFLKS